MLRRQEFTTTGSYPLLAAFSTHKVGKRQVTTVELATVIDNELVDLGGGASICAPGDRCDARLGEKKALAQALRNFTRGTREVVQEQLDAHYDIVPEPVGYGAGV